MFNYSPKELAIALQELLNAKWITEKHCKKLKDKEFRYICAIKNKYGTDKKIVSILERAIKRPDNLIK